jgi:hypothetical protein
MKLSVLLTLILFNITCLAQVKEKDFPSNRVRCQSFELDIRSGKDSVPLPFSRIQLMDVRSDTSKYGYFRSPMDPEQYKFCFKNGASNQLTNFVNGYLTHNLSSTSTDYVLMCLKRFWITKDDTTLVKQGLTRNRVRALLKAEFYLYSNNAFHPLFRCDTMVVRESTKRVPYAGLAEELLSAALERLKNMDYERAANARSITKEEIEQYYGRLHDLPSLTANSIAKGVFRTFEEFKQNRPSDTAFELKFELLADQLYVKDKNGALQFERKVWGICDGQNVFIWLDNNFYQLFRHQNTWEFYGIHRQQRQLVSSRGPAPSGNPAAALITMGIMEILSTAKYNERKINVYQVDMETGKVF